MFPVVDLWRLYLIHPGSAELFKGTDKGAKIIATVMRMLKDAPNSPLGLCCSRFFANMFNVSTNKWALYDKRKYVCDALKEIIPMVENKNTKIGISYTLMNFGVAMAEKSEKDPEGKKE